MIHMDNVDNQWVENVQEEALQRNHMLRGDIERDRHIDPILDEVRMWNAGGSVMQYPFGFIVTFPSRRHLFRGEAKRYPHTESTLSRTTCDADKLSEDLLHVLSNMRICQFGKLLWRLNVSRIVKQNFIILARTI